MQSEGEQNSDSGNATEQVRREGSDILIVDDSLIILQTTSQLLREEGYSVRTAVHGRDALDQILVQMPALILLDLMMPVMDGWEFSRALREVPGGDRPRVLILSAVRGLASDAHELGADGFLGKPYSVPDLLDRVEWALSHPRTMPAS